MVNNCGSIGKRIAVVMIARVLSSAMSLLPVVVCMVLIYMIIPGAQQLMALSYRINRYKILCLNNQRLGPWFPASIKRNAREYARFPTYSSNNLE